MSEEDLIKELILTAQALINCKRDPEHPYNDVNHHEHTQAKEVFNSLYDWYMTEVNRLNESFETRH